MLKLILATAAIVGSVFALFLLTAPESTQDTRFEASDTVPLDETDKIEENADFDNRPALIIGSENAPVTLVEYGDFKCPACNQFHHSVGAQLRDEYVESGDVKIEFRNYPFLGPDSGLAARGSYCANDQGVFQAYHDKVYEYVWEKFYSQGNLGAEFEDILTTGTLQEIMKDDISDIATFASCLASKDYNRFIDADLLLGADDGITGTPGFVLAGQTITGPSNYNTFKTLIELELRKL